MTSMERHDLRKALFDLSVTKVEAEVSGYGDSGYTEDMTFFQAEEVMCSSLVSEELTAWLDDFFYTNIAQAFIPGFENNEGGEVSIVWDVFNDKVTANGGYNEVVRSETPERVF